MLRKPTYAVHNVYVASRGLDVNLKVHRVKLPFSTGYIQPDLGEPDVGDNTRAFQSNVVLLI